ncbi:MAG: FtsX-like permease family protein [Paraperlucidibaca sp.]|nr:FtsX-like permease family protein [Paraperlucidibaca sp.]MBQ0722838.1 FtsX-like permease family protein [Paraperlucidibaca sp.]MBQ0842219.1 FtsX-like permease family protein [Paraperlucidibaca sp.]
MKLAWRLLSRDIRAGEIWLLLAALILAVAATTSLRFFSSSLEQGLTRQAASLLGADLVLDSSRPLRPEVLKEASKHDLQQATVTEFSSMIQYKDEFQLAAVKAVSTGYPLRGELQARRDKTQLPAGSLPASGTLWLDERLFGLLAIGFDDEVQLGDIRLRVTAVLTSEPDRAGNFSAFAPRALINAADVEAAGLIQPGSRVQYRLLLAGPAKAVADFNDELKPKLAIGERLQDVASGRSEVGTPLARASDYLSIAAIAAVILSGLAVALAARRHAERHYDTMALMRCLGASRRRVQGIYLRQLGLIWAVAIVLGAGFGALASQLLFQLLDSMLPTAELDFAWQRPLLTGIATATLTLLGFALPALIGLFRVSPLRVIRRELAPNSPGLIAVTALALSALAALLMLETGRWQLTLLLVVGGSALAFLLTIILRSVFVLLRKTFAERSLPNALLGLRELWRQPQASTLQILALSIGMTAMLLVTSVRGELITAWQSKLPANAPNQFALGIDAHDTAEFRQTLADAGINIDALYPVIRGRLTAINGESVVTAVTKDKEPNLEALNRELNLTISDTLPLGNELLEGEWANPSSAPWPVSIESKLAEKLGVGLGDRLMFTLAEGDVEATVSSLRKVDWDSFQPNFYMVFPPAALADFPATYLTAFHVPSGNRDVLNTLLQRFPTVVLIDVDAIMTQVRKLLDDVSRAIEFVLLFVLAAGVLVLLACIAAGQDQRRQEAALLRALGASRRQLMQRGLSEMILLGGMAGLLAVVLTELLAAALYITLLDLPPTWHGELWLITPLLGAALTGLAGMAATRKVWRTAPAIVLRDA